MSSLSTVGSGGNRRGGSWLSGSSGGIAGDRVSSSARAGARARTRASRGGWLCSSGGRGSGSGGLSGRSRGGGAGLRSRGLGDCLAGGDGSSRGGLRAGGGIGLALGKTDQSSNGRFFILKCLSGVEVSREDSMAKLGGENMQSIVERCSLDVVKRFLERLTGSGILELVSCKNSRQDQEGHEEELQKAEAQHD